jgi:hypothetical protein
MQTPTQVLAALFDAERSKTPQDTSDYGRGFRAGLARAVEEMKQQPLTDPQKDAVRDFIDRLHVISDHLVEEVGQHTCGTGPEGHYGAHEPGCGFEMITPLKDITLEIR